MGDKLVFARVVAKVVALGLIVGSVVGSVAVAADAAPAQQQSAVVGGTDLGPNVFLFTPAMSQTEVQSTLNTIANAQLGNEFGDERYALLFAPGTYGSAATPLQFQVGYYTDVMGLGQNPNDVVINGSVNVYNRCTNGSCDALKNFWRSMSNLTISVGGGQGCYAGNFWATSQGTSLRRMQVKSNGQNMTLMDYCTGPAYASGGFIADSSFSGSVINGSQQQYVVRNSTVGGWSNSVFNQVFVGTTGAPAESFGVNGSTYYTTIARTPVQREKPYLYLDGAGALKVFVPSARTDTAGTSWGATTNTPGTSLPISSFYVASPSSTVSQINAALAQGLNLLLTPGVYQLPSAITVTHANTVVLGLGLPTLRPTNGNAAMTVAGVAGVDLSNLIFDAGSVASPTLLDMAASTGVDASNPSGVHDVYFRVGGAQAGKVDTAFELDTSNVVLDHVWAWRADHGTGVGWTDNTATTGLKVRGSGVTAYGLFVEHFQGDQVVWNGAYGRVYMMQNEMPYDPPSQAAWRTNPSFPGHAALTVRSGGTGFRGYGMGSYSKFNQNVDIHVSQAFTLAPGTGASVHNVETVFFTTGSTLGAIDSVVNGTGGVANSSKQSTPVTVVDYAASASDTTSTSVSCGPAGTVGTPQTCQVAVTDTAASWSVPSGQVSFSSDGSGTFDATTCTLGAGTCSVAYTPSAFGSGAQTITAAFAGSTGYAASQGTSTLTISPDTTSTSVTCGAVPSVGSSVSCTATVADTSNPGTAPAGTVAFASDGSAGFSPSSCTLSGGACAVVYTPTAFGTGSQTVSAAYAGSTGFVASSGSTPVAIAPDSTTTTVSCARQDARTVRRCTATVTNTADASRTPTGTVTFDSTGSGTFDDASCTLTGASCSVTYTAVARSGAQTVTADFAGGGSLGGSEGSATFDVDPDPTSTTVTCGPAGTVGTAQSCTVTVTGVGTIAGDVALTADGSGTFGSTTCTLDGGTCTVRYTPTAFGTGTQTVTATYAGTADAAPSSGTATLTVTPAVTPPTTPTTPTTPGTTATTTTTSIACARGMKVGGTFRARCRISVTDTGRAVRPTGSVVLKGSTGIKAPRRCTLTRGSSAFSGTCVVTVRHPAKKSTLRVSYPGTSSLKPSSAKVTFRGGVRPVRG